MGLTQQNKMFFVADYAAAIGCGRQYCTRFRPEVDEEMQKLQSENGYYNGGRPASAHHYSAAALLVFNESLTFPPLRYSGYVRLRTSRRSEIRRRSTEEPLAGYIDR